MHDFVQNAHSIFMPLSNPAVAAVDLGSNSFHLIIANGNGETLAAAKESVRLAAGLNKDGEIEGDTRQLALDTLTEFKKTIASHQPRCTKAVGTSTFRRIQDQQFIRDAEAALGIRIEIIAGETEAEYIYRGACIDLAEVQGRRMILDIGGGSTELAVGKDRRIFDTASIETGCVRATRSHAPNGNIDEQSLSQLYKRSYSTFCTYRERFGAECRDVVAGTSGTIRSAYAALEATDAASNNLLSRDAVDSLLPTILQFRNTSQLSMPGVSDRRKLVFPAGITLLRALMHALDIQEMQVISTALREGLIQKLLRQEQGPK